MRLTVTSTALLQGLRDGDRSVWRLYVERYRPLIVGFGRRAGLADDDAEDFAQTTLLAFSRAYCDGRFDREKGRLRSWLFGIARNTLRTHLRKPAPARDGASADALPAPDDVEALWDREWREAILRDCMEQLRREVRPETFEAFRRFALEDEPADEVARSLGTTPNAVYLAKKRLLARLRELLPVMEDVW